MTLFASIFESPILIGGVVGGFATLVFFAVCYAKKIQIGKGNKMGLNFDQTSCPGCGTELPRIRRPASLRQMLWGGWTCSSCGKEYDKWMNEVEKSKARS